VTVGELKNILDGYDEDILVINDKSAIEWVELRTREYKNKTSKRVVIQ